MTATGVPVDLKKADETNSKLLIRERELKNDCKNINIWAVDEVCRLLHSFAIETPKTDKGNNSAPKAFLESIQNPIGQKLIDARQIDRLRGPFLEKNILNNNIKKPYVDI